MTFKNTNELDAWSDGVEKRLGEKWAANYAGTGSDHTKAYRELGGLAKGIARGDTEKLVRWGMEHKANVGTPLVSDNTTGSYLTTPEIQNAVQYAAYQSSVLLPLVQHTDMGTRQKQVPVAETMVSLVWQGDQTSAFSEVSPTFSRVTLSAYSVGAFACVTESMLEDDDAGLGQYLVQTFGEYLGYELDYQIARGATTPWDGVLTDAGKGVVLSTGNTLFTDIGWDDLVSAIEELESERWLRGSSFVFHPTVVAALRTKKNANGDYILRESLQDSTVPRFLGYPVYSCDAMPSTSAASTAFGFFGNLKRFVLGDRVAMNVERFDKTYAAAQYETVVFRARGRYAGAVTIPNAFVKISTPAA